jgi:hypothetical protein
MKIVTKNYSLKNGERSYLVYLRDHNNKSLECYDVNGEERLSKENELSEKYKIGDENIKYISLEEFKDQEDPTNTPLFLIFYLDADMFNQREAVQSYGANVKQYLDEKGDNVRLFFMPTKETERIECINPIYIEDKNELEKLNKLVGELEDKFQIDIESKV